MKKKTIDKRFRGNDLKEIAEGELASQDDNPEQDVPAMWKATVSHQGQSNHLV